MNLIIIVMQYNIKNKCTDTYNFILQLELITQIKQQQFT